MLVEGFYYSRGAKTSLPAPPNIDGWLMALMAYIRIAFYRNFPKW
jgi:hypothetical protein